jgi:RimJ/RimL family protein N-acetyltransferase
LGWPSPLAPALVGSAVRLEPLSAEHEAPLFAVSQHPEIWRLTREYPSSREAFGRYFAETLAETASGNEFAFATIDAASGAPVGSTRYLALREADLGVEIGHTWLTPSSWRTGINVEAKLLMLGYAFETLGCIRVELKTHAENQRSRQAMTDMGAWFEGIHRKHRIVSGVGIRDTAWFSVIDDDWPVVKEKLQARLAAYR